MRYRFLLATTALAMFSAFTGTGTFADEAKASRFHEDALARLDRRDVSGAIIQLKNALQEDSRFLAAHALLGRAFLMNSQPDAAQDALEKALRAGIDPSEVAVPLSQALLKQGKAQEVLDRFSPDTLTGAKRSDLLVVRGQALKQLGSYSFAEQAFREARDLQPKSITAILSAAELRATLGRFDEAQQMADQALAIDPRDPSVWYVKGTLHHQSGDASRALGMYAKALEIAPGFLDARIARTSLLLERGQAGEVAQEVAYLGKHHAEDPRGNYLRAVYLGSQGDSEGTRAALAAASRVLAPLSPDLMKKRLPEFLLLSGMVFHGLNEHQRAQSYLEAYLSVVPGHTGARKVLGSILNGRREYVSAIKVLELAQRAAPNDPEVLALLGEANLGRNRPQVAAQLLQSAVESGGAAPQVQSSFGLSLIQAGRADQGLAQLRASFEKDPSQVGTGTALVLHHLRRQEAKRAAEIADKILQRHPNQPALLNLAGLTRAAAGDAKSARAAYERAIAAHGGFPPALLNLAKLDAQEGKLDAARTRLTAYLQSDPRSVQAIHELARLDARAGRRNEAVTWLEKAFAADPGYRPAALDLIQARLASGDEKKALEIARILEARNPEDLSILAVVVRTLGAAGDEKAALQLLTKMTRIAKFDPVQQTRIARLQLGLGNVSGAAYSLEKALSDDPGYFPALGVMAEVEVARSDLAAAEQRGQALVKAYPSSATGYRVLGDVAYRRGQLDAAEKHYREAVAREPGPEGALRVAGAMFRSTAPERGLEYLESWLAKHPNDLVAGRALAEGYLRTQRFGQARARLEGLLAQAPEDVSILNNLAAALSALGDRGKALQHAEKALALAPGDPAVRDTVGWLMVKNGAVDAGLRHLREARLRDPRNPEIRYHLAAALAQSGREEEARTELQDITGMALDFPEANDARVLAKRLSPM